MIKAERSHVEEGRREDRSKLGFSDNMYVRLPREGLKRDSSHYGQIVYASPHHSYAEILTPNMMVFGVGAFGRW